MSAWSTVALSEVTHFIGRGIAPKYSENSQTVVINQKCVRDGRVNLALARRHDEAVKAVPENRVLKDGDCLVNSTGQGTLGRSAVYRSQGSAELCTVDSHLTIVRPDLDRLDPGFLGYCLGTLQSTFEELATGSGGQIELSRQAVGDACIPLPPLDEQKRIVAKLDEVARCTEGMRRLICERSDRYVTLVRTMRRDVLRQAATQVVEGPKSLGDLETLGYVQVGRGKVISKRDMASSPGDFPVYSSSGTKGGEFGRYGQYMFDEEMITWSVDGGGHLFYRPRHKFSVTNVGGWIRILRPDLIECEYLFEVLTDLHSRMDFDWVSKAHSGIIKHAYQDISLPTIEVQRKTVEAIGEAKRLSFIGQELADEQALAMKEFLSVSTVEVLSGAP